MRRVVMLLAGVLALGLVPGGVPGLPWTAWAQAPRTPGAAHGKPLAGAVPKSFRLPLVKVGGKAYYRTWRVTSPSGLKRITDKSNGFRWFHGGGQYGEGFYLFRTRRAAQKFMSAEAKRGAKERNVLCEVLLPKEKFDKVDKRVVTRDADWGLNRPQNDPARHKLRDLRSGAHILLGRWAPSPTADEPVYAPLNGAQQMAVVQLGQPSILNEAIVRMHEPRNRPLEKTVAKPPPGPGAR